jgi:hypothetical protein
MFECMNIEITEMKACGEGISLVGYFVLLDGEGIFKHMSI